MAGRPWAAFLGVSVLLCLVRSAAGSVLLPKCCPLGESYLVGSSGASCFPSGDDPSTWRLPTPRSPSRYNFTWRPLPCDGPGEKTLHDEEYAILEDGSIGRSGADPSVEYCLEYFIGWNRTYPAFCYVEREEPAGKYLFIGAGFFLSAPFAAATLLTYALLKELHSLHGSIVARNMACFVIASVLMGLSATRIIPSYGVFDLTCATAGYAIQFFFMATFFWLNVMCFDIYWAFSGLKNLTGSVKERERKKLILYSVYAWCSPLIILVITVAVDFSPSVPSSSVFKPQVGVDKCFFKNKGATWIYFYLPMALIIISNVVLFGVTAYRIWSHRRETAVLKRPDSRKHDSTNDKERFSLYLKLFIVMGINWVMELLSSIVGGPGYLWYIPDFTNTLQGVFIFLIFVWKKRVRRLVWAKICACFGKKTISTGVRTPWSGSSTRNTTSTESTRTANSVKMNPTALSSQSNIA